MHLVADDFGGHECLIGIEPLRRESRSPVDVAPPKLPPRPDDEVRDALLGVMRS